MKDRLIQLRKALNLSMEAFGKKIGVGRSTISRLESGTNGFTDQMTRSICREFGVNYEWFVSGVGEMFSEVPQTVVDELCAQYDLDDFDRIMLQEYLKMDEASRNVLKTYIRKIRRSMQKSNRTGRNWNLKQVRRKNHQLPTRLPKKWHKNKPVKMTGWKDGHYGII